MHVLFLKFAGYNYQRKVLKFYPQLIPEGMKLNQKVCYWNIPRDRHYIAYSKCLFSTQVEKSKDNNCRFKKKK